MGITGTKDEGADKLQAEADRLEGRLGSATAKLNETTAERDAALTRVGELETALGQQTEAAGDPQHLAVREENAVAALARILKVASTRGHVDAAVIAQAVSDAGIDSERLARLAVGV